MKLLTKWLEKRFKKIGSQDGVKDPIVIAKFFSPLGAGTWFATEWNAEKQFFSGYVSISGDHCDEWGIFTLAELKSIRGLGGLGIERDLWFGEKKMSEACPKAVL